MFKLPASERLTRWRDFRKSLSHLPLNEACQAVVILWDPCPFNPYFLDPANPNSWPDPWTLLEDNWYCDIAKALGMLYTIKYTNHNPKVEIRIYRDSKTNYDYNILWINDGKYILNLERGEVSSIDNIEQDWKLVKTFNADDLKLDNY